MLAAASTAGLAEQQPSPYPAGEAGASAALSER
jgi:hypothetical protein